MTPKTKQAINKFCAEKCGHEVRVIKNLAPDRLYTVQIMKPYIPDWFPKGFDIFDPSNPALLEVMDKLKIAVIPDGDEFSAYKPVAIRIERHIETPEEQAYKTIETDTPKIYKHKQRPIAVALAAGWKGEIE